MEYENLVQTRRSVRNYRDKPVPPETVEELLKECVLAPSSSDRQPWKIAIVNNKELMKKISDESKRNILAKIEADPDHPSARYEAALSNPEFNVFYNAPHLAVIAGPKDLKSVHVDCALFAAYFMFGAAARGLGTCWINMGADVQDEALRLELGLTGDLVIVAPLIFGFPAKVPPPTPRREPQVLKVVN